MRRIGKIMKRNLFHLPCTNITATHPVAFFLMFQNLLCHQSHD